jgi:DNA-binding response OmpR family regulator
MTSPCSPIQPNDKGRLLPLMNILIVEDHDDTREVLERFLSRKGFDVTIADNVQNGLTLLRTKQFGAIVSDIMLPDGTGYGLMSEARRHGVASLAIALTAYGYPAEVNEPKLTGFDYHLRKPIDCEKLVAILEAARTSETDP